MERTSTGNFERISITAKFVAYWRQYTDIPFAKDVAEYINANKSIETFLKDNQISRNEIRWYAPLFEIRYKSIEEFIRKEKATQILELASGLPCRGITMTQHRDITYVETDLEELTNEKRNLISILSKKYPLTPHGKFHLTSANALDSHELQSTIQYFRKERPLAIVTEGLLPYLTTREITIVAKNIREILVKFGGIWITPDFSLQENYGQIPAQRARVRDVIATLTGRRLHSSAFENEEHLASFFEELEFHTEKLYQTDLVSSVVSIDTLKLPHDILEKLKHRLRLWVLTPV